MHRRGNRALLWALAALIAIAVISFSGMEGEPLAEKNRDVVGKILPAVRPLYRYDSFGGRIDESIVNSAAYEYIADRMFHWIHIILFAILTAAMLFAFRKPPLALACALYAYVSELAQESILGRAFEWRDVCHNWCGIAIGLILYLLIRRKKRAARVRFDFLGGQVRTPRRPAPPRKEAPPD